MKDRERQELLRDHIARQAAEIGANIQRLKNEDATRLQALYRGNQARKTYHKLKEEDARLRRVIQQEIGRSKPSGHLVSTPARDLLRSMLYLRNEASQNYRTPSTIGTPSKRSKSTISTPSFFSPNVT